MISMRTEKLNEGPIKMKVERLRPHKPKAQAEEIATTPVARTASKVVPAVGAALLDQYPWTSDGLAEELGMPVASFRAWKMKAEQTGKITKPARGSLLCIEDPEVKMRLRYSDAYLDKLKALRGTVRKHEVKTSAMQHAKLKLSIPVFDEQVAKFLVKKFKDEKGIEEHLRTYLLGLAKPAINKIDEIKKRYEAELAEAMSSF